MRLPTLLTIAAALAGASPALAAGCIRGAVVGGVAGHYVGRGHAVLGAAAGCAYGRHRATVARRRAEAARAPAPPKRHFWSR